MITNNSYLNPTKILEIRGQIRVVHFLSNIVQYNSFKSRLLFSGNCFRSHHWNGERVED